MKSWYTIRCPDGYTLKEWADTETDAKQKCAARLGFPADTLRVCGSEPFRQEMPKDYKAMARGAALGLAILKGEQKP